MEKKIEVKDLQNLPKAAEELLNNCKSRRIFAIYGKMGAGKTTFIKSVCRQLGSEDDFSSPTFAIINEYAGPQPIYHMDLYRLTSSDQLRDTGMEEHLHSGNYCFIEWPELAKDILPPDTVWVHIQETGMNSRTISIRQ